MREIITAADVYTRAMRQVPPSSDLAQCRRLDRRRILRLTFALPWVVLGAGCGQKGPLYHPPEPDEQSEDDQTSAAPPAPGSFLA